MSLVAVMSGPHCVGFPRVSGDEPDYTMLIQELIEFSPRERG